MSNLKPLSLLSLVLFLALAACSKNDDPVVTPPVKTIEELLTMQTWKLEEARFLQNNVTTYYKRGSTANGNIYDVDSIKFKMDLTGVYTNSGGVGNFTWSFLDSEKTKIKLILEKSFIVNWENISATETALRYTEYYILPGTSITSLGGFYRTKR